MVVTPLSAWVTVFLLASVGWCSVGVGYGLLVQQRERDDELCGWTEKKSREQKK